MNTHQITGPTEPFTLDQLRVITRSDQDTAEQDALLLQLQTAARVFIERTIGRLLGAQTWRTYAMYWPQSNYFLLPSSPVTAIDYVQYQTETGLETMPSSDYVLQPHTNTYQAVQLQAGHTWPTAYLVTPGIMVTYSAGYDPIPQPLLEALSSLINYWFDNPEAAIASTAYKAETGILPMHFMELCQAYSLWRR